jgi:hypothetical protein
VSKINSHHGKGMDALFEIVWKAGDRAWLPYHEIVHLEILDQYFEALGVTSISSLPRKVSADSTLPLSALNFASNATLHDVVLETISSAQDFASKFRETNALDNRQMGYKGHLRTVFGKTAPTHSHKMSFNNARRDLFNDNVETFTKFHNIVMQGHHDPLRFCIPVGYSEQMIYRQFDAVPPAVPEGASVCMVYIDRCNTLVLVPPSQLPMPVGRSNADHTVFGNMHSRNGKANPKQQFDNDRSTQRAKGDFARAQVKSGKLHTCGLSHDFLPCEAKHDATIKELQAQNEDTMRMLSELQNATMEANAAHMAIPGQEARFANRVLDNRSSPHAEDMPAIAGPSTQKKKKRPTARSSASEASRVEASGTPAEANEPEDDAMGESARVAYLLQKLNMVLSILTLSHAEGADIDPSDE